MSLKGEQIGTKDFFLYGKILVLKNQLKETETIYKICLEQCHGIFKNTPYITADTKSLLE
jgi:hypothetical protein